MYLRTLPAALALAALASCTRALSDRATASRWATAADWEVAAPAEPFARCASSETNAPDTTHLGFWPVKEVRVGFHVVDRAGANLNLDSVRGRRRLHDIVRVANHWYADPPRSTLAAGGVRPPRTPTRKRLAVVDALIAPADSGVAFHYDADVPWHVHRGRNRNIGSRAAFEAYGARADSVLNVFVLAHHPDSVARPGYKAGRAGVAVGGRFVKIVDDWTAYTTPWPQHANLMHEIGHIYSLQHAWRRDGCDDTPVHPNCWNVDPARGCAEVSNNVMDYTAAAITYTPCQVGRMYAAMSRPGSVPRGFLAPNWCAAREGGGVTLRDSFALEHATDLEGDLVVESGGHLVVRCRLGMPAGARIRVMPGGTLELDGGTIHNDCGREWGGVEVVGRGRRRGRLVWHPGSTLRDARAGSSPERQL